MKCIFDIPLCNILIVYPLTRVTYPRTLIRLNMLFVLILCPHQL